MCGLAGLAVGCGVAPSCPKRLLAQRKADQSRADGAPEPTTSPLASWASRASVRSRPHPIVDEHDVLHFPSDFVPVARHSLVVARGAALQIDVQARQLHRYLHFTAKLEHLVVNRTVLSLAHQVTGLDVPDWMRLDAFKIYVDEGYHALVAAELAQRVAQRHQFDVTWQEQPYFLRRLDELLAAAGSDLAPLVEMLFVVVSETLISGTLSEAAALPDLGAPVRQALGAHAHDERRHHAYFAQFLRVLWPQLDPSVQKRAAVVVPDLIDAFLRPDFAGGREELLRLGFTVDEAVQIMEESYPEPTIRADRRDIARHTVRYFDQVGALATDEAVDAFERADLLTPASA